MSTLPSRPGSIECPIWKTPAEMLPGYTNRDGVAVDSSRAGGRYFISRSAEITLRNNADDLRVKLTHEIVDHNAVGSIPEILTTTLDGLRTVARSRPTVARPVSSATWFRSHVISGRKFRVTVRWKFGEMGRYRASDLGQVPRQTPYSLGPTQRRTTKSSFSLKCWRKTGPFS